MQFVVIMSACFAFSLFAAVFYRLGQNIDRKKRRLSSIGNAANRVYDEELSDPFVKRFILPAFNGIVKTFSRLLPRGGKKQPSKLEKDLILAGIRMTPSEYTAIRFVYMFCIIGLTLFLAIFISNAPIIGIIIYIVGIIMAFGVPYVYLNSKIKIRQEAIRKDMPDILDLLTVSVEAGLSFDGALVYIEEFSDGPLVQELSVVKREIQMGLSRREAMRKLTERNSVDELKTFIGALIQTDQIGIPIRNVLRTQASSLRLSRKQIAEEKALKTPVKMMLPLVLFILPVTFIILLGPAAMNISKVFT